MCRSSRGGGGVSAPLCLPSSGFAFVGKGQHERAEFYWNFFFLSEELLLLKQIFPSFLFFLSDAESQ